MRSSDRYNNGYYFAVNFLDVTLNLYNEKYYPYRKPNDRPFINTLSNHPPSIRKPLYPLPSADA